MIKASHAVNPGGETGCGTGGGGIPGRKSDWGCVGNTSSKSLKHIKTSP